VTPAAAPPSSCVLDANVALSLVVAGPLSVKAHGLFTYGMSQPGFRFHVPDLFFIECANALWKYVRFASVDVRLAEFHLTRILSLPWHVADLRSTAPQAFELANLHGISAYDASYVALAQQLSLPLITADEKLVSRMSGASPSVLWLGDLHQPVGPQ
jgi:predicted nucleic acid-binding protein